ncbi:MAG: hypothetical protein ACI4BI_05755 [Anaerotardibacter sp.]
MFCLYCGTKVDEEHQDACENCGMTLAEMRLRIARAEEMITYADTVGPSETQKLPPVSFRHYTDLQGNPIDPAQAIQYEGTISAPSGVDLNDLPQIASEDPYLTMPIQKIVSQKGEVVVDLDNELRTYVQPIEQKSHKLSIAIGIIIALLIVIAVMGYMLATK